MLSISGKNLSFKSFERQIGSVEIFVGRNINIEETMNNLIATVN